MDRGLLGLVAVVVVLVLPGCGLRWPGSGGSVPVGMPVGLVAEGPAFREAGTAERVRAAIEPLIGRPVVLLSAPERERAEDLQKLAARPGSERAAVAEARDRPCGAGGSVAAGIAAGVGGVYRVSLDHVVTLRAASDTERAGASWVSAGLGLVGLGDREQVREEQIVGSVRWIPFVGGRPVPAADVTRTTTTVSPTVFTSSLDPVAVTVDAIESLPAPVDPDWAAFGGTLARGGCPHMAIWLAETRLERGSAASRVKSQALAALGGGAPRPPAPRVASPPPAPSSEADSSYSCRDLCGLHMVELCNGDRVLWDANQTRWEASPCGTRRSEGFLQACYAQQWQSGTFFNACVLPCEGTVEGRQRLIKVLESSGCLDHRS